MPIKPWRYCCAAFKGKYVKYMVHIASIRQDIQSPVYPYKATQATIIPVQYRPASCQQSSPDQSQSTPTKVPTNIDEAETASTPQKRRKDHDVIDVDDNRTTPSKRPRADKENCPSLGAPTPSKSTPSKDSSKSTPSKPGTFKPVWENDLLVTLTSDKKRLVCMQCHTILSQIKKDNAQKHVKSMHPDIDKLDKHKKQQIKDSYRKHLTQSHSQVQKFLGPQRLIAEAPYKLAFIIGKNKMPFSNCDAFVEWARSADPTSEVFSKMSSSRQTITRKVQEIHSKVIQPEIVSGVNKALYWSYIIDESVDKKTKEQLGIFIRFIDIAEEKVAVKFLAYENVEGRPTSSRLFTCLDSRFKKEGLPMKNVVAHTCDNAAVVASELNGLAAKARSAYNDKLYIQRCTTHTEVLVSKDGQKKIPVFVERTIKEVLNHFRWSAVKSHQFEELCELNDEKYTNLVTYHRVRWLSLEACVERVASLLQTLAQYFDEGAHSMDKVSERKICGQLYNAISSPEFHLYLFFLRGQLPQLGDINRELQTKNQTIYNTYRKIFNFMRVFVSPVVCDDTVPLDQLMQHENLIDLHAHDVQDPPPFGGTDFRDYWIECINNGHLSEQKLKEVLTNCYMYIITIGRSFLKRFPEADFILKKCMFLEPSRRSVKLDASLMEVVERFDNGHFDMQKVLRSYRLYRLDDTLTEMFEQGCQQTVVRFFCQLYKMNDFREFAKLCILLLTVQPDTCDLERGFSTMNYVKSNFRTQVTQENLNACVSIALDSRTLDDFPFNRCID